MFRLIGTGQYAVNSRTRMHRSTASAVRVPTLIVSIWFSKEMVHFCGKPIFSSAFERAAEKEDGANEMNTMQPHSTITDRSDSGISFSEHCLPTYESYLLAYLLEPDHNFMRIYGFSTPCSSKVAPNSCFHLSAMAISSGRPPSSRRMMVPGCSLLRITDPSP